MTRFMKSREKGAAQRTVTGDEPENGVLNVLPGTAYLVLRAQS